MRWWICATAVALSVAVLPGPVFANPAAIDWDQVTSEAIEKLQGYIRVDTTNPPGNETPAAELLRGWLAAEGIDARLYDPMRNPDRQALVARIPGRSNSTIVLMSHSDVVPAAAGEWSHPPFGAEIAEGILYGRGVLDTKELGIFQLMTLLLLHRYGITPRDSLLLLIEPDEEEASRGVQGMLERYPELFRDVSLVLNEGGSGVTGTFKAGQAIYFVQTAEKGVAWMRLKARGDAGHGSIPLRNNAVATMARALNASAPTSPLSALLPRWYGCSPPWRTSSRSPLPGSCATSGTRWYSSCFAAGSPNGRSSAPCCARPSHPPASMADTR